MPCNLFRQRRRRFAGRERANRAAQYSQRNARRVCAESSARAARSVADCRLLHDVLFLPDYPGCLCSVAGRRRVTAAGRRSVGAIRAPGKILLREIHCLRGTPRRWGLFGENDQEQINNISLGIIDLVYPAHWQPYIAQDLGQQTDIDIYLDRHVVRQGDIFRCMMK